MEAIVRVAVAAAALISSSLIPTASAQTPVRDNPVSRTATSSIRGRVVEAGTGIGLVRALVTVTGAALGREGRSVTTDLEGRFVFDGLSTGHYALEASKVGYVTLGPGQRRWRQPSRSIEIAGGQSIEETNIVLPRAGGIVVLLTDASGEPIARQNVLVEEYRTVDGNRQLMPARQAREPGRTFAGAYGFTNDLGQLRVHDLAPGEYYVSASSGAEGMLPHGDKQLVVVSGGQEAPVSLLLSTGAANPARRVRVSGFVVASNGAPVVNATLSTSATRAYVSILPDGSFEMDVTPGEHRVTVRAGQGPGDVEEWGRTTFRAQDEDVNGVTVDTVRAGPLRGRLVFDTGKPPPDLQPGDVQLAVLSAPETFGPLSSELKWNADWSFEVTRLAGPYLLRLRQPTHGWHLKAIVRDGRDLTDTTVEVNGAIATGDVEVHLTRGATLTGGVLDSRNMPAFDCTVVVFPENRSLWSLPESRFIATGRSDQQGQFRITGLPPGRYVAAAVEYLEATEERDPYVLGRISGEATPFTLEESESKAVMLRLSTY